jgi:O-antigen/teichoic acid export membrane protein
VLRQSTSIGIIQVTNTIYLKADLLLLSLLSSATIVAEYGLAYQVINYFVVIPIAYMTSLLPIMTNAEDVDLKALVTRGITLLSAVGALFTAGCICAGPGVIHILAGPKFVQSETILSILSVSVIMTGLTSVFGFANFSRDRHHSMLYVSVTGLTLNVIANLIVIPRYHAIGAAYVLIASEVVMLAGTYWIFRQKMGQRIPVVRYMFRPIVASALCALIVSQLDWPRGLTIQSTCVRSFEVVVSFAMILGAIGGWPEGTLQTARQLSRRWLSSYGHRAT